MCLQVSSRGSVQRRICKCQAESGVARILTEFELATEALEGMVMFECLRSRAIAMLMHLCLMQDYCITCPTTGTLFSLKTGEIVDW